MRTPGLTSPDQLIELVTGRLEKSWSKLVCGTSTWNPEFHLGTSALKGSRLRDVWTDIHLDTLDWRDWATTAGEGVELVCREVSYAIRNPQDIAATVLVESEDVAARLLGEEWVSRLARARARHAVLTDQFPTLSDPARMLRFTDIWSDVDFDLLCRTAAWFAAPHERGLTARQIPVEGLGTKWLDKRKATVRTLAGVDSLELERGRPQRVHLTYLDPIYLGSGGRKHDLVTVGDKDVVAYRPRVVLISENRDTAQQFPPIDGAIAVEGDGNGPGAVPLLEWVREAELVVYWGDMDARGLEILNDFRVALGGGVTSLFMDLPAYERWERFGVDHDHDGKPLKSRVPREVDALEPGERDLYLALCSPQWDRHRRIEQERIPLVDAATRLRTYQVLSSPSATAVETSASDCGAPGGGR